ncbi:uncharacterized protein AMSG_11542 [Thecamonas trahens ATCC 50062]|uniref:DUF7630 domain-containing protein n=1 Tax=Thecamonas trahens ATCC 50062 TaxID=461836 RepID=A0A0L0D2E9_THETB|nr:hypothetical protein AMSG_11542 [Thecamonas trahens ATCC 50062]KNC46472.1 hypothetical protein AMSG_11542 [Thecamonas trahens ATCC 50062]|eukprot:XP_013752600.1 hypothetical protein AMSG_11542 [Thecamonas trahens ATCC 50062]
MDYVGIVDVDGDGRLDVVATSSNTYSSASFTVFSTKDGLVWSAMTAAVSGTRTWRAVADVNGDGLLDAVTYSSGGVRVALQSGRDADTVYTPQTRPLDLRLAPCMLDRFSFACVAANIAASSRCVADTLMLEPGVYSCVADAHFCLGSVIFECADAAAGRGPGPVHGGRTSAADVATVGRLTALAELHGTPGLRVNGNGAALELRNATIRGCRASEPGDDQVMVDVGVGGAVLASGGGRVAATGSLFADNSAAGEGGSLAVRGSGTVAELEKSVIDGSMAGRGGGVSVSSGARLEVRDGTVIRGCTASGDGGGAWVGPGGATLAMVGGEVSDNTAGGIGSGGGLHVVGGSQADLDGVTVRGNRAGSAGGGLAIVASSVSSGLAVARASVDVPEVTAVSGDAERAKAGYAAANRLSDCVITGNTAGTFGHGLAVCGEGVGVSGAATRWRDNAGRDDVFVCAAEGVAASLAGPETVPWLRVASDAAAEVLTASSGTRIAAPLSRLEWVTAPAGTVTSGDGPRATVVGVDWLGREHIEPELDVAVVVDAPSGMLVSGETTSAMSQAVTAVPGVSVSVLASVASSVTLPAPVSMRVEAVTSRSGGHTVGGLAAAFEVTGCGMGAGASVQSTVSGNMVVDVVVCAACVEGTMSTSVSLDGCVAVPSCPLNTQRLAGSGAINVTSGSGVDDCVCKPGFWSRTGRSGVACDACPRGGVCDGGLDSPRAAPGFFPDADSEAVFVACPASEACLGSGQCAAGYTARLCAQCADGYFALGGRCRKCRPVANAMVTVALLIGALVVTGVLLAFNLTEGLRYKFAAAMIGLNGLQMSAIYGRLDFEWGPVARVYFDIASAVNLDVELTSPECSLVRGADVWVLKWALTLILPVFVALAICGAATVYGLLIAQGSGWWFETAIMARKAGLVLCMTFMFTDEGKASMGVCALAVALGHLVYVRPYASDFHNRLAMLVLAATTLALYGGTLKDAPLRMAWVSTWVVVILIALVGGNGYDLWRMQRSEKAIEDAEYFVAGGFATALASASGERPRSASVEMGTVMVEGVAWETLGSGNELALSSVEASRGVLSPIGSGRAEACLSLPTLGGIGSDPAPHEVSGFGWAAAGASPYHSEISMGGAAQAGSLLALSMSSSSSTSSSSSSSSSSS